MYFAKDERAGLDKSGALAMLPHR